MLVTQDGFLVIKQWNYIPEDTSMLLGFNVYFRYFLMILIVISAIVSYVFFTSYWKWSVFSAAFVSPALGYILAKILFVGFFMLLLWKTLGSFSVYQFLLGFDLLCPGGCGSELKLVVRAI
jgi:hypothetical protein